MKILSISGSSRSLSSNAKLLDALPHLESDHQFTRFAGINDLPLFKAEEDQSPWPKQVLEWRQALKDTDALIICTPEYIHNLPALIKNALEWITSSGELYGKPVLALTFTPSAPRGEKTMKSLLWTLGALDARVVGQLPLYQNEMQFSPNGYLLENEGTSLLREAIRLLAE